MLLPDQLHQLIHGLEGLAGRFEAASGGPAHAAYVAELRRVTAELRELVARPAPGYMQRGYLEGIQRQVDLLQAELEKPSEPAGAAAPSFTPWEGEKVAREMLEDLGLVLPEQRTRRSKAVSQEAWEDWDSWQDG
ncbi:MAG: hypothetical protein AB7K24_06920 [Gemmataceae bacterium]